MTRQEQIDLWRRALPFGLVLVVEDGTPMDDFGMRLSFMVHDQACRVDLSQAEPDGEWFADIHGKRGPVQCLEDVWQALATEFARRLTEARQALQSSCQSSPNSGNRS